VTPETARALWLTGPGRAELRPTGLGAGEVVIEARFSGISRGSEALVFAGAVPEAEWTRMRARCSKAISRFR
jgi:hypothetical protein